MQIPTTLLNVTLDNRKISFHPLFITAPDRNIVPPLATTRVIHKNDEDPSRVLAFLIRRIQIVFRVHIYPDSYQSEDFLFRIPKFSVNGYFEFYKDILRSVFSS